MLTLREYVKEAEKKKVGIGHFNISSLEALHGIYNAAKKLNVPVIIGLSEGEAGAVSHAEAALLVKALRERDNHPIFINADHHKSFESVKDAINAGFDSVIIDGTRLGFEENVKLTKQCVEYARGVGREVLVEGELGYIGEGSIVRDSIPEGAGVLTKPEDAKKFVEMTGVSMLAPSVGSIHGLIKSGKPHINTALVAEIRKATGVPLVLHGGSGLRDEDFTGAIAAGVAIVHINTEIRVAFVDAIKKFLAEHLGEVVPYKILKPAQDAVEGVVLNRLKLFNNIK